ncbi:MAG: right-handed parallel beta-helix repeat-containing protein [Planctomycetes bacterium]|nr:right-handed parallel beta-helix repeat-containing protein [Planctomycetota bacterium]
MKTTIERLTFLTCVAQNVTRYLSTAIIIVPFICLAGCPPPVPESLESDDAANVGLGPANESPTLDSSGDASPDAIASALVTFGFEVTVTYSRTDEIAVGQQGVGRIMYDTSNAMGFGRFDAPPANFELELGSVLLVAGSKASDFRPDFQIDVRNDKIVIVDREEMDALSFWGHNIAREIDGFNVDMALILHDTTGTLLNDRSIPHDVPLLSDFDLTYFQVRYEEPPGSEIWYALMNLSVDAITEVTDGTADGSDEDTGDEVSDGADTIYVDDIAPVGGDGTNWATAFTHLQDALAVVSTGDEIHVAVGIYRADQDEAGNVAPGDRFATFQLLSGVAIYGGYAGLGAPNPDVRDIVLYETILSGALARACVQDLDCGEIGGLCVDGFCNIMQGNNQNSFHIVTGSGTNSTAILDGFSITAANANGTNPYNLGAGMYNSDGSPTVTNCTFEGNTAATGGGMYNGNGSNPTVTNCSFIGNMARGFRVGGGGMNNNASNPTVANCKFSGNSAATGGGIRNNNRSNPTVTNCAFSGNSAAENGGGMYNIGNSHATVTNCTFSGNSAVSGGGMYNQIVSNPVVTNCTFSGNSGVFGGGMGNNRSSPTVTNCILWGNRSPQIFNTGLTGTPVVNYSVVQGGWTGAGGVGNIDADPLFVDADGPNGTLGNGDHDLRILPGSPAIDSGSNAAVPEGIITDIDGNPRFADDPNTPNCPEPDADCGTPPIVDMGAFEIEANDP